MLKFVIFILTFASVGLICQVVLPVVLEKYHRIQEKRVNQAAKELDDMFLRTEKKKLFLLFILIPVVFAIGGFIIFHNLTAALIGAAIGFVSPNLFIGQWELVRKKKLQSQLLDSLVILSGSLKAGLSLLQAFEEVVKEMAPPISQEFSLLIKENRMGIPLEECLRLLKRRIQLEDVDLFITAILVARQTGGDLTYVLSQLASTIRERDKLHGRVKALTVQARIQGLIMEILPIVFVVFLYKMNPRTFEYMLQDKLGQSLLMYAVVSEILGIFFIHKFSRVEV